MAAGPGSEALIVDAGAHAGPLLFMAEYHGLRVKALVLTHHHHDHVAEASTWAERHALVPLAHELEIPELPFHAAPAADGDALPIDGLDARLLWVPGHTRGQLNVVVEGAGVFTGDTLFAGSVGGTRGPRHGTFDELRASILGKLMALPGTTAVRPGHGDATTIDRELASNPFVRLWRGEAEPLDEPCTAFGRPATLRAWARDYDGGWKAQVDWPDGGTDVVPGSQVVRERERRARG